MAVAFHDLWSSRGSVLEELRALQTAADNAREGQPFAALRVQRLFREFITQAEQTGTSR